MKIVRPVLTWFFVSAAIIYMFAGCSWLKGKVDQSLDDVPDLASYEPAVAKPIPSIPIIIEDNITLPYMTKEQSKIVIDEITEQFPKLKVADYDMTARFCPNYYKMTDEKKILVWSYLADAIVQFESGTDDGLIKKCVKFTESNGEQSIGFFQLSYGNEFCPMSKAEGDLCDVKVNIPCAVKLMGRDVSKDRVVTDGGYVMYGAKPPRGLARYWAVVRVPDKKSTHHLMDIMEKTKKFPGCT